MNAMIKFRRRRTNLEAVQRSSSGIFVAMAKTPLRYKKGQSRLQVLIVEFASCFWMQYAEIPQTFNLHASFFSKCAQRDTYLRKQADRELGNTKCPNYSEETSRKWNAQCTTYTKTYRTHARLSAHVNNAVFPTRQLHVQNWVSATLSSELCEKGWLRADIGQVQYVTPTEQGRHTCI